jgi:hypothetical protein
LELPLLELPLLENPLLENPLLECPLLECPLLENPLLECPLLECPLFDPPLFQSLQPPRERRNRLPKLPLATLRHPQRHHRRAVPVVPTQRRPRSPDRLVVPE